MKTIADLCGGRGEDICLVDGFVKKINLYTILNLQRNNSLKYSQKTVKVPSRK